MRIEDYNPKAREAFGQNLIDISLAINKGIILLITVIPLGFIAKVVMDGAIEPISFIDIFSKISGFTYVIFGLLLSLSFYLGGKFKYEGLKHIHESENWKTSYPPK